MYHFHFWPNFFASILYVALNIALGAVVYEIPVGAEFFGNLLCSLVIISIGTFFIHIVIKNVGQLSV